MRVNPTNAQTDLVSPARPRWRHVCFLSMVVLAVGVSSQALLTVIGASLADNRFSHILVVAPISLLLIFVERRRVFANLSYNYMGAGLYLLLLAVSAYAAVRTSYLSLSIFLLAGCCIAAFLFSYGTKAFWRAQFPVLFLALMTPLPEAWFSSTIGFLQSASAVATGWCFSAAGIPFTRDGMVLVLPRVTIEIAEECSGIRSSVVLFLSTLVLGHLFLKTRWSQLVLAVAVLPITIIKNAFRIFSLSTLAMYVDPSFLTGKLHHRGGFVFFALAFVLVWVVVWLLQRLEARITASNIEDGAKQAVTARVS